MNQIITSTEVEVDLHVYPLIAVQKTAAALASRCVAEIAQHDATSLTVSLRPRHDVPSLADPCAEFVGLLNDITLQDKIAENTKDIRAALVRAAFFEALPPPK